MNDLPAVDYPVIQVQVSYSGASPDTVANAIATPLERQFMQINGPDHFQKQPGKRKHDLAVRAQQEHRRGRHGRADGDLAGDSLPIDLPSPPTFSKTNDQPIMYIALTSDSVTPGNSTITAVRRWASASASCAA